MRVVAGSARGAKLLLVPGEGTRPILDRVKTALFDILRPRISGLVMLDLFAGSGSVGIEALSQGAAHCTFIDRGHKAVATIKRNLEITSLQDRSEVLHADALQYLKGTTKTFDLIYVAPPQYKNLWIEALGLVAGRLTLPGGRGDESEEETAPGWRSCRLIPENMKAWSFCRCARSDRSATGTRCWCSTNLLTLRLSSDRRLLADDQKTHLRSAAVWTRMPGWKRMVSSPNCNCSQLGHSSEASWVLGESRQGDLSMRRCILVACAVIAVLSSSALVGAGDNTKGNAKSLDLERIMSVGQEDSQVMDHLDVLCNRIGPRLTGSDNLTNACEWARDRFASFGIDNARIEPWGEFPVGFDRGPWFGRVISPEPQGSRVHDDGVVGGHEGGGARQGRAGTQGQEGTRRGEGKGHDRRGVGVHAAARWRRLDRPGFSPIAAQGAGRRQGGRNHRALRPPTCL